MPKILIPDAESRHTLNVMHCLARQKDIEIYIVSSKKWAYCKFSKFCQKSIFHDFDKGSDDFLEFLHELIIKEKIDFIFPVDAEGIELLAQHKEYFNGVCKVALVPEKGQLQKTMDKWNFFLSLKNTGIRIPETELLSHSNSIPLPVIVKPRKGESGKGIHLIMSNKEYERLVLNKDNYIVQEYIKGYDIDCSFLAKNGVLMAYTIQKPLKRKGGELDFSPSKDIQICHEERVIEIIKSLVEEMKWNGVAHADLRYCQRTNQFYLIEINPRYWSSLLGSLAAGVNFPLLALVSENKIANYEELFYYGLKSKLRSLISLEKNKKTIASTLRHILIDPMPFLMNKLFKKI